MDGQQDLSELALKRKQIEGELSLKQAEFELKREETRANLGSQKQGFWFASPLTLAIASAVFGLLGTAMGAAISGYWNTRLEQQKFEFTLIQRALDAPEKEDRARNLSFLVEIGLIQRLNRENIERLAKSPEKIPQTQSFSMEPGVGIKISVADAKRALTARGFYKGPIDDTTGADYRAAVVQFQKESGELPDGMVGPATARKLNLILAESSKP